MAGGGGGALLLLLWLAVVGGGGERRWRWVVLPAERKKLGGSTMIVANIGYPAAPLSSILASSPIKTEFKNNYVPKKYMY